MSDPSVPPPRPTAHEDATPTAHEHRGPSVVPVGTLMLVAVVLLSIIWLWMLVLGIQQGRAS
ncbi:hypothetical protein [Deinococcus apachensis]|uniref:hypothetical protein n=1 Tax=Deinococcus apachensis TaxID=309886 RepID=UPI00036806A7|nr:hypothetical protein [Deinococcus apachensis]